MEYKAWVKSEITFLSFKWKSFNSVYAEVSSTVLFHTLRERCRRILAKPQQFLKYHVNIVLQDLYWEHSLSKMSIAFLTSLNSYFKHVMINAVLIWGYMDLCFQHTRNS